MEKQLSRRRLLAGTGAMLAAGAVSGVSSAAGAKNRPRGEPFGYCLNTSTLRGQKLTLEQEIDIAGKAGYHAIEPWIGEIDDYVKRGGSLSDLKRRIADRGLTVESAIGFFEWIVDDDARRAKALEEAKRNMDLLRQIGGKRIAAPPLGATDRSDVSLLRAAERYRALLDLGDQFGVVPQVEVWGFSKTLGRLGEAAFVAIESGHRDACILPDVYHLYRGGSAFEGVGLLSDAAMHVFHVNDVPARPPREQLNDSHRIYPGDGIAPIDALLRDLNRIGFRGYLSLELFNREYWQQDALVVARTGLEKIRAVVRRLRM
ncbi:MAG: sugar phosphate isomerase/epimerase [Armatimonadetes bacterium]|nr:sugar phosphate isomerase/epimerase [Armatimonadota bacterium]